MKSSPIFTVFLALVCVSIPACHKHHEHGETAHHKIVVTSPRAQDVVLTQ